MKPMFRIFIDLSKQHPFNQEELESFCSSDDLTELIFKDITRVSYFYTDPEDDKMTIIKLDGESFGIPLPRKKFEKLLMKIEHENLYSHIILN